MIASRTFVVIGAGGLGCPALLGLRMAGARRIDVIDCDRVELSNLHRQVLYDLGDVGAHKAEVAAAKLRAFGIDARSFVQRVTPDDVEAIVAASPADAIVLECTDQPALKFAANDACVRHGRSLVLAASLGLRGHVIAVVPGSACYRCVFEAPPPLELVPTCASAGVLGTAVGTTGFLQAHLAVAIASNDFAVDDEARGRLLELDLSRGTIRALAGRKRRDCICACEAPPRAATPGDRGDP
ncbi:MAG TPA: HesA/MoeB/ThiF family protein [Nannocystaceae bacterium]|nr:HesA/MoeB/ThiF family protein [Nannocystaceae bacterium]